MKTLFYACLTFDLYKVAEQWSVNKNSSSISSSIELYTYEAVMVVVDSMWRIFVNTCIIYNFVSSGSMYRRVGEVLDNGHLPLAYI